MDELAPQQVDGPQARADGDAHNGPHGGPAVPVHLKVLDDVESQAHADNHLGDGLNGLGGGGGHHVGAALEIPPDAGLNGDEEQRGRQGHNGIIGFRAAIPLGNLVGAEEHHQAAKQPQEKEQPKGHGKHPVRLPQAALGSGRAHHAGDSHRQPRRGEH